MSVTTLPSLIDKQDTAEIVRDRIAEILAANAVEQESLASAAGKDPNLYTFQLFTERSMPFEQFINAPDTPQPPLVNIMFDQSSYDQGGSNIMERQKCSATYNIDCFGYGKSRDDAGGGQIPGDRDASFAVHRCLRLVRTILMAGENTYLQLRGIVWQRWPQSIVRYQPSIDGQVIPDIVAARLAFDVTFNEFAPQIQHDTLEQISIDIDRADDGKILLQADYDYT